MVENPMTVQDQAHTGLAPRIGDGHSTSVPATHGHGRVAPKQPRFAVTPAKMREAFFFRWKLALLAGFVLALVGVGIAWVTYKPKYTATSMMQMTSSKPRLLTGAQLDDFGRLNREEEFQKTQAQLIKSHGVLDKVLQKDDIRGRTTVLRQDDPRLWLEKELQAGFIPGTDIFRIALTSEEPEDAALIVNAVRDEYVKQFKSFADGQVADRLDIIEKVMGKAEEKIRSQREVVSKLANALKTADSQVLTLRQKIALDEYATMKRELGTIESDVRRTAALLTVQLADLKAIENEKLPTNLVEEFLDQHPLVQKEHVDITYLEAQIKEYRKTATPDSPRLRQFEDDVKAMRAKIQKIKIDIQPEVMQKIRSVVLRQRTNAVEQSQEKLKVLAEQKGAVAKEVASLSNEADAIGRWSFDIELRRQEIEEAESVLKKLRSEKERLEIEQHNRDAKNVNNVQRADVPTLNQASLLKTGSLYGLAGLLLGVLGICFLEARVHRVHKADEIPRELGIQTLGVLPLLAKKESSTYGRTIGANESLPAIMFTDAVNNLCAHLLCDDRLRQHSVIMITSAGEDEGKTMLATQMAAGLARSGRRTLLIDCDFRKPRCHHRLGVAEGPGLSEVLCGAAELNDVLQTIPETEARLLTAGQCNPQVVKALSNGKFAALLGRLRQDFDCIIIDSAPTPVVSDGLLIGKLADGVILVVRSKVSKGPAVLGAYDQLAALKIPTLGVVVNANSSRSISGYYHHS